MIQAKNSPIYTELVIQDFGEGISDEELPHIFERFYKSSSSKSTDRPNWIGTCQSYYRGTSRLNYS